MISLIRPSMTDCPYHPEIISAKRDNIKLLLEMLGSNITKYVGHTNLKKEPVLHCNVQWL